MPRTSEPFDGLYPDDERALIVTWLRVAARTSGYDHDISGTVLEWVADAIERGDHLTPESGD